MNARLFRFGINLWPPFLFTGIHVTRITPDYRQIDVELRLRPWNRNYVGTHFGGSLFAMTDPFWMLGLLHILGRDYYVWDRAGAIDFLKPGRGTVRTSFRIDDALLQELRTEAASGEKVLRWFSNDVVDEQGEVVAQVRKQVYLRLEAARTLIQRAGAILCCFAMEAPMRPYAVAALLIPLSFAAHSLDLPPVQYPVLPAQATTATGFVPEGWSLESSIEGDLDQDGRADLVLVLRQQDPRNVIEHDGFGPSPYDSNPRILAVAWSRPSGYVLAVQDHQLIPRPDNPVMSDPLEEGSIGIQRGTLRVALFSFASAGSWSMGTTAFTFRWQDGAFALIGYDQDSVMRNSGQTESLSVNFSTRRLKRTEGNIEGDKDSVRWQPLRSSRRWTLQTVGDGWAFDPLAGNH